MSAARNGRTAARQRLASIPLVRVLQSRASLSDITISARETAIIAVGTVVKKQARGVR